MTFQMTLRECMNLAKLACVAFFPFRFSALPSDDVARRESQLLLLCRTRSIRPGLPSLQPRPPPCTTPGPPVGPCATPGVTPCHPLCITHNP